MAVTKPIKMGNVELEKLERQGTRKFLCVLQTIDFKRLNKGQIIKTLNIIHDFDAMTMQKFMENKLTLWLTPDGKPFFKEEINK